MGSQQETPAHHSGMHRPWRRDAARAALLVGSALLIGSLWLHETYGAFWIGSTPAHVSLCDQEYTRFDGAIRTRSAVTAYDAEADTAIVLEPTVGRIPFGLTNPARFHPSAGYQGCGHILLLHLGPDGYAMYYALGGP